jgi:hypothetical protein
MVSALKPRDCLARCGRLADDQTFDRHGVLGQPDRTDARTSHRDRVLARAEEHAPHVRHDEIRRSTRREAWYRRREQVGQHAEALLQVAPIEAVRCIQDASS